MAAPVQDRVHRKDAPPAPEAPAHAGVTSRSSTFDAAPEPQGQRPGSVDRWRPREVVTHGWIGAGFYDYEQEGGSTASVDDDVTVPAIGGGAQLKLGGDKVDFGIEGLLGFAWSGSVSALATGSGGAVVAVDVDIYLFELFGGPFVNVMLGRGSRLYAGAGPVLQWASYDQDGPDSLTSGDGDGFGAGYYARVGIEFDAGANTMIGIGARWTDACIDLGGGLGDLDLHGVQAVVTVSHGL
jgi:hypothetical protein